MKSQREEFESRIERCSVLLFDTFSTLKQKEEIKAALRALPLGELASVVLTANALRKHMKMPSKVRAIEEVSQIPFGKRASICEEACCVFQFLQSQLNEEEAFSILRGGYCVNKK